MMTYNDLTVCGADAVYRYTWPGRDEAFVCEKHSKRLQIVANAMGLPLQLIPVPPGGPFCTQKVSR